MVSKAPTVFKRIQKSRQFSVCELCLLCHLAATPIVQRYTTPPRMSASCCTNRLDERQPVIYQKISYMCNYTKGLPWLAVMFLLVVNHFFHCHHFPQISLWTHPSVGSFSLCRQSQESLKQIWATIQAGRKGSAYVQKQACVFSLIFQHKNSFQTCRYGYRTAGLRRRFWSFSSTTQLRCQSDLK